MDVTTDAVTCNAGRRIWPRRECTGVRDGLDRGAWFRSSPYTRSTWCIYECGVGARYNGEGAS